MAIKDAFLQELDLEAETTRRVLARVPDSGLGWKPHPKSMSLGQLALHVATTPGGVAEMASLPSLDTPPTFSRPEAATAAELLPALDQSVARARELVDAMTDDAMLATWTMKSDGRVLLALPRMALLRSIMLNHWYHHRGQLSVYLRQLEVPVPSIYGPSADESPFAASPDASV